jgi:hypothetical protein
MMQTLVDLLNTAEGLDFLAAEGVFASPQTFRARLKMPAKPGLAAELGLANHKLVCSGQQLYVDYRHSVLSKILALQDLEQEQELQPFFLWVDTDRTGSDSLITKFAWPQSGKKGPITIMPPGAGEVELRFASPDPAQLTSAMDRVETFLRQSGEQRKDAKQKYQHLRLIFTAEAHPNLGQFNLRLTNFLLAHVFGFVPRSAILSRLLESDLVLSEINLLLNHLVDGIRVFNEAIQSLTQRGINPQVTPLADPYLPLFYSCETDSRRLRLYHRLQGQDHFAVSACKCGREYKFYLGRHLLSVAELAQTGRWSPDVCFPIFFNDLVSGFVAGKSSAIYLIVMNQVLRKVLGKRPVPILVPESLKAKENGHGQFDSLIYRYFTGV